MDVINVMEKFSLFQDQWSPKVIADLNGQQVKLAKIKGEFVWHDHKDEDELFYILKGELKMLFRDGEKLIKEGEIIVVPKGVEHKPIAEEEVWVMLFEPADTKHTGDVETDMTVKKYERI